MLYAIGLVICIVFAYSSGYLVALQEKKSRSEVV